MSDKMSVAGQDAGMRAYSRSLPTPPGFKGGRKWARLAVDYMESDQLVDAGPIAELAFIRITTKCAQKLSDGKLSRAAATRLCSDLPGGPASALDALERVELLTDNNGMLTVTGYLLYQNSAAELLGSRSADAARKVAERAAIKVAQGEPADTTPALLVVVEPGEPAKAKAKSGQVGYDPRADLACDYLANAVHAENGLKLKPKVTATWRKDMHSVLKTADAASIKLAPIIDAAFRDDFWRDTMHTPASLKRNLTQLLSLTLKRPATVKGGGMAQDDLADLAAYDTTAVA